METTNHITNTNKLVSNETEIFIDKPIREVYKWVVYEPLEIQLPGTDRIPAVISTKTINNIDLGNAGHRRIVCLADGNTAVQEHTYIDKNEHIDTQSYFSYRVSDYTLKVAENIEYALGEWWFTFINDKTHVRWRYSFKLRDKNVMGRLGFIGRALFRNFFIKTSYDKFMIKTLNKLKFDLEQA